MIIALLIAPAFALDPYMSATLGASQWALGVKATGKPGVEQDLWSEEGSLLFGHTYARGLADVELSPSYLRVGPELQLSPIAVLELSGQAVVSQYFGTFSSIIGFDDPDADYSDDVLDDKIDQGLRGTATSFRIGGDATLQGQVGPVALVVNGAAYRWTAKPSDDVEGAYYFEPEMSLMLAWEDTTLAGAGLLLYEIELAHERTLLLGSLTLWQRAIETRDEDARTGLIGLYTHDEHWSFVALVQPYLLDRVYTSPFPPYIAGQAKWTL